MNSNGWITNPSYFVERASVISRCAAATWYCFKWGLIVTVLLGLVAAMYFSRRVDEEIRLRAESFFGDHYQHLTVEVHSARLVEGQGITIKGLSLADPRDEVNDSELAYIDELALKCSTSLSALASGDLDVQSFTLRRPRLRLTCSAEGVWDFENLLPLPQFSERFPPPDGKLENATIEVIDRSKQPPASYTLRDVNLSISHEIPADLTPEDRISIVHFSGYALGDHLQRIELTGKFDGCNGGITAAGTVRGVDISPEFHAALPVEACQMIESQTSLRARVNARFVVNYLAERETPLMFDVTAQVSRGRLVDARLPGTLTDLEAQLRCTHGRLQIKDLKARSGETTLTLSLDREGWQDDAPMELSAKCQNLQLDRKLFAALKEKGDKIWNTFQPQGLADVNIRAVYDGQDWRHDGTLTCRDVSFRYEKFPYLMERGSGVVTRSGDRVTADLVAYARTDPVKIDADIHNPGADFTGWMQLAGWNLTVHQDLLASLPEKSRPVMRSLNPNGTFDVSMRLWRDEAQQQVHKHLRLTVQHGSVRYVKFPYPIDNIRGAIEMRDDAWSFPSLQGTNDSGRITCGGSYTVDEQGGLLQLEFTGTDVPLERELRDALQPGAQQAWLHLSPRGSIDLVSRIRYRPLRKQLNVYTRVEPRDSASIELAQMPYRWENLRGAVIYEDGRITLENLAAQHDRVRLSTGGHCVLSPDGWRVDLENLVVDRLAADRELLPALPPALRQVIQELKPTGTVNLQGKLSLGKGSRAEDPLWTNWSLALYLHQNSFSPGVELKNASGEIVLQGKMERGMVQARGQLNLDSVTYKDFQFTEVRGPLTIENSRLLIGVPNAEKMDPGRLPHLTARFYDGRIYADAWVVKDETSGATYSLRAALADANLERLSREALSGGRRFTGKVYADLNLRGKGTGTHTLVGNGRVSLREADIYQLPILVSVLKVLRLQPPGGTAFTTSDIEMNIQAEHIYFNKLNFNGDAVSLIGQGEMNFDKDVHLTFGAVIGNNRFRVPLVSDVVGGATRQILQIRVDGPLEDPEITRQTFPALSPFLKRIEAELQRRPPGQHSSPSVAPRASMPARSTNRR